MLFAAFIRAYMICLVSTLSLYIVVDLFTNIDDFFQQGRSGIDISLHILTYYGYRTIQYYDRLCEALCLLAAMFTVAWTQRSNEIDSDAVGRRVDAPLSATHLFRGGIDVGFGNSEPGDTSFRESRRRWSPIATTRREPTNLTSKVAMTPIECTLTVPRRSPRAIGASVSRDAAGDSNFGNEASDGGERHAISHRKQTNHCQAAG